MNKELAVILEHNGVAITADDDRLVNLTALWKAAGADEKKRPAQWLRWGPTQEFIDALATQLKVRIHTMKTKVRRTKGLAGTWAHWQIALAYCRWLSPEFHLKVNEAFMRWVQEERDPGLKMDRGIEGLLASGADPTWVEQRAKGKIARVGLTGTMATHGCRVTPTCHPYKEVSVAVSKAVTGLAPRELRSARNAESRKTRDHMSARELARTNLLETEIRETIVEANANGNAECVSIGRSISGELGDAFRRLDAAAGAASKKRRDVPAVTTTRPTPTPRPGFMTQAKLMFGIGGKKPVSST